MARDSEDHKFITVEKLQTLLKTLPADARLYPTIAFNIQVEVGDKYIAWIDVERELMHNVSEEEG